MLCEGGVGLAGVVGCGAGVGATTGGFGLLTGAAVGPGEVVEPPPGVG